jgi:hypothetical protein
VIKHAAKIVLTILSITVIATSADATPKRHRHKVSDIIVCNRQGCSDRPRAGTHTKAAPVVDANGNSVVVGHRPAGCPHAYCGCEASLYVFGKIRPMLNVARNWRVLFPRTAPAPGMAAVRTHHVMVLMSHVSGNRWLVHDGNSGGGLIREHVMSIHGYTIVDPHGHSPKGLTAQASYNRD